MPLFEPLGWGRRSRPLESPARRMRTICRGRSPQARGPIADRQAEQGARRPAADANASQVHSQAGRRWSPPLVWGDPALLWALLTGGPVAKLDTGTLVVWTIHLPRRWRRSCAGRRRDGRIVPDLSPGRGGAPRGRRRRSGYRCGDRSWRNGRRGAPPLLARRRSTGRDAPAPPVVALRSARARCWRHDQPPSPRAAGFRHAPCRDGGW